MKTLRSIICAIAMAGSAIPTGVAALPLAPLQPPSLVMQVQANCNAVGQQIASQNGGTLAKASSEQRGGQAVCVIVVLIPARDGARPRREEFVVPQ